MPKLVTQASVCVIRDGKRVFPEIGKAFPYTAQEVERVKRVSPTALRKPLNESAPVAEPEADEERQDVGDAESTNDTAPEGTAEATSNKNPKTAPAKAKNKTVKKPAEPETDDGGEGDEDEDI